MSQPRGRRGRATAANDGQDGEEEEVPLLVQEVGLTPAGPLSECLYIMPTPEADWGQDGGPARQEGAQHA